MAIILVGGGARSGKSRWAMQRARQHGANLIYIATAEPSDEEMSARIARHRAERGQDFITVEEPLELARAIRATACDAVVVDCLTLWLSNLLMQGRPVEPEIDATLRAAGECAIPIVFVTNEVGCGIVPRNDLAREFRDWSGLMNQRFATAAGEVYWMVFGQGLKVK